MRRCFYSQFSSESGDLVFPAYAGMFLKQELRLILNSGFPRVCGDVSLAAYGVAADSLFSPRMRGCFQAVLNKEIYAQVFPAYAGMFPVVTGRLSKTYSFPRVCGDVSGALIFEMLLSKFSPRMRGCFYQDTRF